MSEYIVPRLTLDEIAATVVQPLPGGADPRGCPWFAHGQCWQRLRDACPRTGTAPEKCCRHLGDTS